MAHYRAPRGTQDILPEDQPYWRNIQERIHGVAQLYGYRQLDVPIFEDTALFEQGVGETTDIVEKEMYSFLDKGGNPITLRPEFTAGVVRAYLQHGMHVHPQPVKVYSIGPVFRYERPQAGRYRQHTQFNLEAIGEKDPAVDLEVMSVAWHLYEDLGFKGLSFQLNSIGCPKCRPDFLKALVEYYRGHMDDICDDCRRRMERNPLRLLDCKTKSCQPIIDAAPNMREHLCGECAEHFRTLLGYLDSLGRRYTLSHRLVRGLDYYTKTVFEVWAEGIGAQNAVCGGGRYDGLAEVLGGRPTPGVGFASGLERIVLTMKQQGVQVPALPSPQVLIAHQGEQAKLMGVKLAGDLRAASIGALISFGERSLKAQLRQANRQKVAFALIIKEGEAETGQVAVRDMAQGEQHSVALEEVTGWLSQRFV